MAKFNLTQTQKYAIVLLALAAALLLALPLLLPAASPTEKIVDPEVFYSSLAESPSIAIIADISGSPTQEAKTAILQCSVDLRSNIINALGKNTLYIACEGQNCLISDSNEANSTRPLSPSQIGNATSKMPQLYLSYGNPLAPAYYKNRAHFWINGTLGYPCSLYSIEFANATNKTQ